MYNIAMQAYSDNVVLYIVVILAVLFFSMTLHELMHGLVAYWLGDDTARRDGRLTLNPIKHIDPFLTIILPVTLALFQAPIFGGAKPVPFNPQRVRGGVWGAALVGLAGPLTNLVLAFISFILVTYLPLGDNSIGNMVLSVSVLVNLGFFAFNILPIPPLDGSRLLYAVAPDPVQRGMEYIERYGVLLIFGIVMVASPIIGNLINMMVQGLLVGFSYIPLMLNMLQ